MCPKYWRFSYRHYILEARGRQLGLHEGDYWRQLARWRRCYRHSSRDHGIGARWGEEEWQSYELVGLLAMTYLYDYIMAELWFSFPLNIDPRVCCDWIKNWMRREVMEGESEWVDELAQHAGGVQIKSKVYICKRRVAAWRRGWVNQHSPCLLPDESLAYRTSRILNLWNTRVRLRSESFAFCKFYAHVQQVCVNNIWFTK